ncbi:MAG TPA: hypothetical protein VFB00_04370 [Terriglobales bacterium]|nr:hypothetical protein [Terriglobales bacterium]
MLRNLVQRVERIPHDPTALLDCLIEAGELETALADADSPATDEAAELTDALAAAFCSGRMTAGLSRLAAGIAGVPETLRVAPPEGFTYYALHPLDFATLASRIPPDPAACAVIGIRSIGTTLGAVTAAALRLEGRKVSRITARPTGHPYSRETRFSEAQLRWIREQRELPAQFLVADEGPGRSGSTFLSVAEALLRAGVPRDCITLLGSREADPESLCAQDAASRWRSFRFLPTKPSVNTRFEGCTYIGGGRWRDVLLTDPADAPESWTQMERLKFLSPDRKTFFKFEGMGPRGAEVRERAFALADAGFSPSAEDAGDGFVAYTCLEGRWLRPRDLDTRLLESIARYCAFRAEAFPAPRSAPQELRRMLEFNVRQEFGVELSLPEETFDSARPILADGRMQPYEWIAEADRLLKTDAVSHGDNHFFPGPCDIAWDLAGAMIEWPLSADASSFLVRRFRQYAGPNALPPLEPYLLAYAVFRLGCCKMAVSTARGTADERRLTAAYHRYRREARSELENVIESRDQTALAS